MLAKTRWGYETFATGGNEQAAIYAGIPTRWVRIRAYLLSSLCATIAGLMAVAQDKGVTPQYGLSAELIVIAAVIIGGASILGGRGRVIGSLPRRAAGRADQQGAARGLADHPHDHGRRRGDRRCNAVYSLPAGAVPAFLGLLLDHRGADRAVSSSAARSPARLWAWLRGLPPPPALEIGGVAIEGAQTKGAMATDKALYARAASASSWRGATRSPSS